MEETTTDTFLSGKLQVVQARKGYRFSIDAIITAGGVAPKEGDSILDLGTGCGIIPLILAYRFPSIHITAIEIQPELAEMARINVAANGMQNRIEVLEADMRTLRPKMTRGAVDWIVCNPPYRKAFSGRINPNAQRAMARHEINIDLHQVIQTARRMLRRGGRFVIIYPVERCVDLISEMRCQHIEPKWMRGIHSHSGGEAKRILVQGVSRGRCGLTMAPELVIYKPDGSYTEEMELFMMP